MKQTLCVVLVIIYPVSYFFIATENNIRYLMILKLQFFFLNDDGFCLSNWQVLASPRVGISECRKIFYSRLTVARRPSLHVGAPLHGLGMQISQGKKQFSMNVHLSHDGIAVWPMASSTCHYGCPCCNKGVYLVLVFEVTARGDTEEAKAVDEWGGKIFTLHPVSGRKENRCSRSASFLLVLQGEKTLELENQQRKTLAVPSLVFICIVSE